MKSKEQRDKAFSRLPCEIAGASDWICKMSNECFETHGNNKELAQKLFNKKKEQ